MLTSLEPVTPTAIARPTYRIPVIDASFNTQLTRICNNTKLSIPVTGGKWGARSRQHYSKDQPVSHDGTILKLQQKSGDPSNLIVDAASYDPLFSDRGSSPAEKLFAKAHETRWRPNHGSEIIGVFRTTTPERGIIVKGWDMRTGQRTVADLFVPSADPKFGWVGEGQVDDTGRWTCFTTVGKSPLAAGAPADYIVVVDLQKGRVGPRCDVSYATKAFPTSKGGAIGNCGISALGNFAELKLSGTEQYSFILDIDHDSLVCTPHAMDVNALRMGPPDARGAKGASLGAVAWLSHPDSNRNINGREVLVGGGRGFETIPGKEADGKTTIATRSKRLGNVLMVDLHTGHVQHVSPGSDHLGGVRAASMQHGSGRAYKRRGWHLCSMEITGGWGAGEIMWVRLGTERSVERVCAHRSAEAGNYDAEAHPVASPDGEKVIYASNCSGAGASPKGPSTKDVKAYVATQWKP